MALPTSRPDRLTLDALAADIARRRALHGDITVPRNTGNRRTASKRALLQAIADAGGNW